MEGDLCGHVGFNMQKRRSNKGWEVVVISNYNNTLKWGEVGEEGKEGESP